MELTIKHIGGYGYNPSKIIELTIKSQNSTITEDITDLKGKVDESLIMSLRELADELEEQNNLIAKRE